MAWVTIITLWGLFALGMWGASEDPTPHGFSVDFS